LGYLGVLGVLGATRLPELTQNWIRSSHGHSTPSLKISCKSVQPFSRNLADKETKKQINKQRKKSSDNNTPLPVPTGGGVISCNSILEVWDTRLTVLKSLQSCAAWTFGSGMNTFCVKSSGILPVCYILFLSLVITSIPFSPMLQHYK